MDQKKKDSAWDMAFGLIKVDGLEPTPAFRELVEREKKGDITTKEIIKELNKKYVMKV